MLPYRDQEILVARIAGAVLKIYPGVGHLVLWECPDQIASDVMAFFDSLE